MNITFFIGGLSGGGAERVVCNMANFLARKGNFVEILTMADDVPSYPLDSVVHRCSLLGSNERTCFTFNSALRLFRLFKYLRRTKSSVIVVMLPITTILLLQMRKFTKAKIICAERSLPSVYSKNKQTFLKRLAYKADGWVFQTTAQKEWYEKTHIKQYKIISNAINPAFINQQQYTGNRNPEIVTVGSLSAPKNHELLISAFSMITAEYPNYKLVIYGKGPKQEKLKAYSNTLGIANRVYFAGYSTNVGESIKNAALFVLSSDYEGMPNALMEAMALGLPCISTDCDGGGAHALIIDGKNGLLVPKGDKQKLADAMRRLLINQQEAEKLGYEAHKICESLAPDRIYGQWEQYIKEIVECV